MCFEMANIKAAIKSIRQTKKRTLANKRMKARMRRAVRRFEDFMSEGEYERANAQLPKIYKLYDKAAKSGIIKKNTSARKKSRLMKQYNTATANVKTAKRST